MYHFEVRGADAKSKVDPAMIKCMCHEVARAHARRTAEAQRRAASSSSAAAVPSRNRAHASDPDDFCVFSHTVMRDILEAKHSKLSFWGATHWCDASDTVTKAIRQMTEADVGALLVMNRRAMDLDDNDVIDEHELRASPESGAIKGIITERDYLRAVALGNVRWHTKVAEVMTDFESAPEKLVSVAPDTSVLAAMEIMTEQRIRHIPCIAPAARDGSRGAKMEGIVTIGDVVKALLSEEREEVQVCRDYISGNFDHYA
jgi:CBS domain-containing protein